MTQPEVDQSETNLVEKLKSVHNNIYVLTSGLRYVVDCDIWKPVPMPSNLNNFKVWARWIFGLPSAHAALVDQSVSYSPKGLELCLRVDSITLARFPAHARVSRRKIYGKKCRFGLNNACRLTRIFSPICRVLTAAPLLRKIVRLVKRD